MAISIDELVVFAARSGNCQLLRKRIEEGADVNFDNGAALKAAAAAGHTEAIQTLIEYGANVNTDRNGFGPLEIALRCKKAEAAFTLLCAGAKLQRVSRPYYRERLTAVLKAQGAQQSAQVDAPKSGAPLS